MAACRHQQREASAPREPAPCVSAAGASGRSAGKRARAGLPRMRFHDLRHGAATYLLSAGVPMRAVMDILGHSRMSTTADIYAHVLPEMRRDASEKVAAVLFS